MKLIAIETARGKLYSTVKSPLNDYLCIDILYAGSYASVYWPNGNRSDVMDVAEWIYSPDPRTDVEKELDALGLDVKQTQEMALI
jgi:hypothetical protein